MIKPRNLLFSLALCCAAAAPSQAAPLRSSSSLGAISAGRRYILPRGSFIAVSESALRRLFQGLRQNDTAAVVGLVQRNEVEKLVRDAVAVPVASRGKSAEVIEVQIPGFIGTVVTPRSNLIAR